MTFTKSVHYPHLLILAELYATAWIAVQAIEHRRALREERKVRDLSSGFYKDYNASVTRYCIENKCEPGKRGEMISTREVVAVWVLMHPDRVQALQDVGPFLHMNTDPTREEDKHLVFDLAGLVGSKKFIDKFPKRAQDTVTSTTMSDIGWPASWLAHLWNRRGKHFSDERIAAMLRKAGYSVDACKEVFPHLTFKEEICA